MATKKFQKRQIVPRIVNSVTGSAVDNTDPENPIINIPEDGVDKTYVHEQVTPSKIWEYEHGLDKKPSVQVTDSAGTVIMGQITVNDGIRVRIEFNIAFWGYATNN